LRRRKPKTFWKASWKIGAKELRSLDRDWSNAVSAAIRMSRSKSRSTLAAAG
jgi:hypothetical protein